MSNKEITDDPTWQIVLRTFNCIQDEREYRVSKIKDPKVLKDLRIMCIQRDNDKFLKIVEKRIGELEK